MPINRNKKFEISRVKSKYNYSPIKIVTFYIIFTYMIHLLLNENVNYRGFIFMTAIIFSIIIGYYLPNSRELSFSKSKLGENIKWDGRVNIELLILISSFITIISSINNILTYYPNRSEILYYLMNPGQSYIYIKSLKFNPDLIEFNGGFSSSVNILLTLLSAAKYIFFIFVILYWKNLKRFTQVFSVFTLLLYLASSFLIGSMITIGSILLSIIPLVLVNSKIYNTSRFRHKKKFKTYIAVSICLFLILFFITNRVDQNNNLIEGVKVLGFYISHGYVGLDYCLELPFEPTYGFTTFYGISTMFVKYLGITDFFQNSYLIRNQIVNGYPAFSIWSTIFPWLASDFSFFFLPLIMGFISFKFSLLWNKTIRSGNPFGYLLLGQLFLFWFMIPANNQLFHTLGNSSSFILIYVLYVVSKKYYVKE